MNRDISKFNVGENVYNTKDSKARSSINNLASQMLAGSPMISDITLIPENPVDKTSFIYVGTDILHFKKGRIYQYVAADMYWQDITPPDVDDTARETGIGAMALANEALEVGETALEIANQNADTISNLKAGDIKYVDQLTSDKTVQSVLSQVKVDTDFSVRNVNTLPVNATRDMVVLYIGSTGNGLVNKHLYKYNVTGNTYYEYCSTNPIEYIYIDVIPNSNSDLLGLVSLSDKSQATVSSISNLVTMNVGNTYDSMSILFENNVKVINLTKNGTTVKYYPTGSVLQNGSWIDITRNSEDIAYDNTSSGLNATNVKAAIDEINSTLGSISTALVPKGTIAFSNLPSLASVNVGWMYNISNDFTTTSDFVNSGVSEKAGSNVYCIDNNGTKKWDVFYVPPAQVVIPISPASTASYPNGSLWIS